MLNEDDDIARLIINSVQKDLVTRNVRCYGLQLLVSYCFAGAVAELGIELDRQLGWARDGRELAQRY